MSVPVLSKHKQFVKPPWMTLFGELQNIFFYFIFYKAKIIPKVILTGNPGGTVIVIKSKNLITKVCASAKSFSLDIKIPYDITERQNKNIRNLAD